MDTKNNETKEYYLITNGHDPHPSIRGVVGFRYIKATENEYGVIKGPSVCAYASFVESEEGVWKLAYNGWVNSNGFMSAHPFHQFCFSGIEDLTNHLIVQHAVHYLAQDLILLDEAIPNDNKQGTSSYNDDIYYHFKRLDPHPILVSGLERQSVDFILPVLTYLTSTDL